MLLFGDRRRRRAWGLAGGALGAATLAGLVVGLLHAPPMAVDPPVVVAAGPPPRARDFPLIDKPVAPRPLPAPPGAKGEPHLAMYLKVGSTRAKAR